jgi:iron complex outermembrane receptor protein
MDGAYKITVKEGATIVFSYGGVYKVERLARNSVINITLSEGRTNQTFKWIQFTPEQTLQQLYQSMFAIRRNLSTGQATFDKTLV